MPMIEFRFKRRKVTPKTATCLCRQLEGALRNAISGVRKGRSDYKVTVEGDPFSRLIQNQPDLRIYIFYHKEWNFTPEELTQLAESMMASVSDILRTARSLDISVDIRFYERAGHKSVHIEKPKL